MKKNACVALISWRFNFIFFQKIVNKILCSKLTFSKYENELAQKKYENENKDYFSGKKNHRE